MRGTDRERDAVTPSRGEPAHFSFVNRCGRSDDAKNGVHGSGGPLRGWGPIVRVGRGRAGDHCAVFSDDVTDRIDNRERSNLASVFCPRRDAEAPGGSVLEAGPLPTGCSRAGTHSTGGNLLGGCFTGRATSVGTRPDGGIPGPQIEDHRGGDDRNRSDGGLVTDASLGQPFDNSLRGGEAECTTAREDDSVHLRQSPVGI
jgi:hypothetical protein